MDLSLIFRTSHGDYTLKASHSETIVDVCRKYGLPPTQMTTYILDDTEEMKLVVRPFHPLGSYPEQGQIVLLPNRNIDYRKILGSSRVVREREGASTWTTFSNQEQDQSEGIVTEILSPADAIELVSTQVKDALILAEVSDEPIVIGVSGGGDSNALLSSIVKSGMISKSNIYPVMMLGIPDWDKGVERAEAICAQHDLQLRLVSEEETASMLGFSDSKADWVTAFEKSFPNDDLEVLGVYGVRKVLTAAAKEVNATKVVVGTNLEDCLADALYYICHGLIPFPQPIGSLGNVEVVCPLWLTPKPIIDGCYPKFSRENYEARYPSRMTGRAYYYYIAQMIAEIYPGAAQQLLIGISTISKTKFEGLSFNEEFQIPTIEKMPFDLRLKLRNLFGSKSII